MSFRIVLTSKNLFILIANQIQIFENYFKKIFFGKSYLKLGKRLSSDSLNTGLITSANIASSQQSVNRSVNENSG